MRNKDLFVQLSSDDWVDSEPSTYIRSYYG